MVFRRALTSTIFFIAMLAAASVWAVSSSLWEVDSKDDMDAGEPDDVSIMAPGQIMLGPKASVIPIDALYAWTLSEDSKGNIYAGTGNDGKIFRISRKGETEVFADLELQQVFALAIDKKDILYAGGFPGGKIFSVNALGEISEYFDTGQNSVWSLYIGVDGKLFVGTGDDGQILSVDTDGKGQVLYDSPERRILSLVGDAEENVFAGSEQNGIIYKIDERGHPFVFYDTELEEVTAMTMDAEGNLYAVSSPGELFMKVPPPPAVPAVPKTGQAAAAHAAAVGQAKVPAPMPGMPAIPSPKKRTCIIYKIAKDGAASKFWVSPGNLIFSIVLDGSNILAGSGDDGIIYQISPTGEAGTYYKAEQKQLLALHRSPNGAIVASLGNDAAIVRFDGGHSSRGTFISQVHDAAAVSRWGKVFWEADVPSQAHISLATRSGNSEVPDDTWSDWSREHKDKEGFVSDSPSARFIQWRATFDTSNPQETPTLRKVTVAYLQANFPPEVQSVDVGPEKANNKKGDGAAGMAEALKGLSSGAASGPGKEKAGKAKASRQGVKDAPAAHKTKLKIRWQARDENGDKLEYELYFRGTDENRWKLLEDELDETSYEWDTEAVPDGEYHVKVVAGDSPSNPEESSLMTERVSEPFMVDNTSPLVKSLRVVRSSGSEGYRISCTVSDNLSPVRSAHYSIDAGDWVTVFPDDGIFDSLSEKVEFATGKLEKGEHTIVVKAIDYFANVGAGKTTFVVK